jgi:hypothetical protein
MKANLTKLINDCISLGLQLSDKRTSTEQAIRQAKSIAIHCLPDDCDADLAYVKEHVQYLRAFDHQEPAPVFVSKVIEFHGKFDVKLTDGQTFSFDTSDITHY